MSEYNVYVVEPKQLLESGAKIDHELTELYRAGRREEVLQRAALEGKNIVIAGGTNAGKTTARNGLIEDGAGEQRIVSIENVGEVGAVWMPLVGYVMIGRALCILAGLTLLSSVFQMVSPPVTHGDWWTPTLWDRYLPQFALASALFLIVYAVYAWRANR